MSNNREKAKKANTGTGNIFVVNWLGNGILLAEIRQIDMKKVNWEEDQYHRILYYKYHLIICPDIFVFNLVSFCRRDTVTLSSCIRATEYFQRVWWNHGTLSLFDLSLIILEVHRWYTPKYVSLIAITTCFKWLFYLCGRW